MRYLVLTDIHANLEALDSCLADARLRRYDGTLVLGDLVGYGADPNAVIERVVALDPVGLVRGNHDKVACGLDYAEGFNAIARTAAEWTLGALTDAHRQWLAALPAGPRVIDDLVEICHGAPFDEDFYLFDHTDALRALRASTRPLCVFGHTHQPATFQLANDTFNTEMPAFNGDQAQLPLRAGVRYLVNPGSVGQPRDGDPRAAYAIIDTGAKTVDFVRVEYEIGAAQAKIVRAGLPQVLARRLSAGR
jgi:diadenosine tetraphosphatase ApaH/serine/threonine PP2A family protein phosphatase